MTSLICTGNAKMIKNARLRYHVNLNRGYFELNDELSKVYEAPGISKNDQRSLSGMTFFIRVHWPRFYKIHISLDHEAWAYISCPDPHYVTSAQSFR